MMGRTSKRAALISALGAVGLLIAACDEGPRTSPSVTRDDFTAAGKVWPLSVPNGEVGCSPNKRDRNADAIWFKAPDGVVYALNSFASDEKGYADLDPIWLEDAKANAELAAAFPGETLPSPNRLSIADLMERAREICYSASLR